MMGFFSLRTMEKTSTLLGTNISHPKALFEDAFPFLKLGICWFPAGVTVPKIQNKSCGFLLENLQLISIFEVHVITRENTCWWYEDSPICAVYLSIAQPRGDRDLDLGLGTGSSVGG